MLHYNNGYAWPDRQMPMNFFRLIFHALLPLVLADKACPMDCAGSNDVESVITRLELICTADSRPCDSMLKLSIVSYIADYICRFSLSMPCGVPCRAYMVAEATDFFLLAIVLLCRRAARGMAIMAFIWILGAVGVSPFKLGVYWFISGLGVFFCSLIKFRSLGPQEHHCD